MATNTRNMQGVAPPCFAGTNIQCYNAALIASATNNAPSYTGQSFSDIPTSNGLPRPWLLEFYNCTNVIVNGVLLTNSPMWNLVLRYGSNFTISNYRVVNPFDSPNTDGVDPVSVDGVTISNADINTGDDNVAISSGLGGVPPDPTIFHPTTYRDSGPEMLRVPTRSSGAVMACPLAARP